MIDVIDETSTEFDIELIRADFPILEQQIRGNQLVYLDNAATSQKPQVVIDAISHYYAATNSNVHRGVHTLSEAATAAYESTREKVRRFINAKDICEIVYVKGTTDAINLVAQSYGRSNITEDDEIIISAMEHHSNIVPWQLLCEQTGAKLKVIPINQQGELLIDELETLITNKTKIIAVTHMSNALGSINPIKQITKIAHSHQIPVLADGAQAISHLSVDVQDLGCDFYAFSSHKLFGPTGAGVLYGKQDLLEKMPPYQGGGEMIRQVSFDKTTYHDLPYKFEAGTPNIAGFVGLGSAIDYVQSIGLDHIQCHENMLLEYAKQAMQDLPQIKLVGTAKNKASILSFTFGNIHAHDVGTILDDQGIAIRTGHHCAMPVMEFFGVPATARASLALYNTKADIDAFINGLHHIEDIFK